MGVLTNYKEKYDHISYLRKIIQRLRDYKLKFKLEQCTFRFSSGKLLGFIVSRRGIEVDPKKVSRIVDLPPHKI